MKRIQAFLQEHREIISYLFWGALTTLVSWTTYSLFVLAIKSVANANILSWICAVLFAFVTNKLWVFHSNDWLLPVVLPEIGKFFASRVATGLLEVIGVPLLVKIGLDQQIWGIEGMLAKVLVSVLVIILNYVLSKLLVFKNTFPHS